MKLLLLDFQIFYILSDFQTSRESMNGFFSGLCERLRLVLWMTRPSMEDEVRSDSSIVQNPRNSAAVAVLANGGHGSSSEISDSDTEGGHLPSCRICLESDANSLQDELISPCKCSGTQQFVHRSCLDNWRSIKQGIDFSHCTTCRARFHMKHVLPKLDGWRKVKFRLLVARDVLILLLAANMLAIALGGLFSALDKDEKFRKSLHGGWRLIAKHIFPFYYCIGVVEMVILVGMLGLIHHCFVHNRENARQNEEDDDGYSYFCYGSVILDWVPTSMKLCIAFFTGLAAAFLILGLLYGVFIVIMTFQKSCERNYLSLAKKDLTKEFVVEDVHGCYRDAPKLDQQQEHRLKALKLL